MDPRRSPRSKSRDRHKFDYKYIGPHYNTNEKVYHKNRRTMSSRQEDLRFRIKTLSDEREEEFDEMPSRFANRISLSKLLTCCMCGVVFGFALEKGRVFEPHIIREQMLFTNFTMLKMFLSACATGILSFSIFTMVDPLRMNWIIIEFLMSIRQKTAASAALGGAMLGAGMTIAGACPGMVLVQVGTLVPYSGYTLLGGFIGTLMYAYTDPMLPPYLKLKRPVEHSSLDEVLECPYFILALPFAAMLGTVVFALDLYVPWYTEVESFGSSMLFCRAWPPYAAGALIGLLQIPIMLTVGDTLGSTSSYVTVLAQVAFKGPFKKSLIYLRSFAKGLSNWWQVFYVGGAILGGNLSARASGTLGTVAGVHPVAGLFGGMLMLYGSRMAGGCTSGHGLSGMGLMVLLSFVAVPAMFAGGMTTAFFMQFASQHSSLIEALWSM